MLETSRLLLRPYTAEDAASVLLPILSDPITMRFWPAPFTPEMVDGWIERNQRSYEEQGYGRYLVVLKTTGEVIGDVGLRRSNLDGEDVNDIGYILHHPYHGHGYAVEAAEAVRDWAFGTRGLDALHANMPHDHHASRRVAEKIGMQFVREFVNARNRGIRTLLYTLRREEFPPQEQANDDTVNDLIQPSLSGS